MTIGITDERSTDAPVTDDTDDGRTRGTGPGDRRAGGPGPTGRLRPTARRRAATPGLATLVVIEVLLGAGLTVGVMLRSPIGVAAPLIAAIAALTLIRWSDRGSLLGRLGRRVAFTASRLHRPPATVPAPFDIPTDTRPVPGRSPRTGSGTGSGIGPVIGARWAGDTLITVLRVSPRGTAPVFLTPHAAVTESARGQSIPLDVLAGCLDPFDIPLRSVDVVSAAHAVGGNGGLAQTYRQLLGPLPATAHRSVLVILRLDPRDCPDAVARRGGGAVGALRAATITTTRVARRLSAHGLSATPLTAGEITTATRRLLDGTEPGDVVENWDRLAVGSRQSRMFAVDPAALEAVLAGAWTSTVPSATVITRLTRSAEGRLRVAALVRLDHLNGPATGVTVPSIIPGNRLRPLPGRQLDALNAGLPVASPARLDRHLPGVDGPAAHRLLQRVRMPAAGCGQLVGADAAGRAVSVRLNGPDVGTVVVIGTVAFAMQTVARAVAIGVPVAIRTADHRRWRTLVASVGDPHRLAFAEQSPVTPAQRVEVYDDHAPVGPPAPGPSAGTMIVAPDPAAATRHPAATVILEQDSVSPQRISITSPSGRVDVTMVTTPQEWALVGAPAAEPAQRR
ncbi:type VII secretion protein EccE [Gordonia sp. NB41Y]|uniref:type VII secretion protein EccE n=1 Tax=Gordonia sp. NB41Y TaxID=875808 RepID=UPI00273C98FA|nr:type VII secretion protein EccE [Gordonia sp. NB41Y]WLP90048.1 type VII secretion protein EccE [Gordonia sp. NB41Y]